METINKVILKGGISGVRKLKVCDKEVARFVLLTRHQDKSKEGFDVLKTELHNVVVWGRTSQWLDDIADGVIAEVEGRLRYVKYTNAMGVDKVLTEIVADKVIISQVE